MLALNTSSIPQRLRVDRLQDPFKRPPGGKRLGDMEENLSTKVGTPQALNDKRSEDLRCL